MKEIKLMNKGLKQLGNKVPIGKDPKKVILEKINNPHNTDKYVIRFSIPEFTSLCPVTGQPDFAKIYIDYVPKNWIVESKSLKLYMQSYRNVGIFHEDVIVSIGNKLLKEIRPIWIRIGGYFYPRGGVPIDVFWQTDNPPKKVWIPDNNIEVYKGRN